MSGRDNIPIARFERVHVNPEPDGRVLGLFRSRKGKLFAMSEIDIWEEYKIARKHNQLMPDYLKTQSAVDMRNLDTALRAIQAEKHELGQDVDVPLTGEYPDYSTGVFNLDITEPYGPDLN